MSGVFSLARRRPSSPSEAVTILCPAFANESSSAGRRNLLSSIRSTVDKMSRYSTHEDCLASYDGRGAEPKSSTQQDARDLVDA
jgi:hypothetical protein